MKKVKGKRLLSLLLTLCMVLSLVPVASFADTYDYAVDAVVEKEGDASMPEGTIPPYTVWDCVESADPTCEKEAHEAHSIDCDHKDGHLYECYKEEPQWAVCSGEDHAHTYSMKLLSLEALYAAIRDFNNLQKITDEVKNSSDADAAYQTAYDKAYQAAYDKAWFAKDEAGKLAGATAGETARWSVVFSKTYCYTVDPDSEVVCDHGESIKHDAVACCVDDCPGYIHVHEEPACYTYTWTLCADVNGNGVPDGKDKYYKVTFEGIEEKQTVLTGMCAEVPDETPAKTYYTFDRWNFNFTTAITKNTDVKAIWKAELDQNGNGDADQEEAYTVVYKADGVVLQEDTDLAYGVATPAYTGETPTKANYNFATWAPTVAATVSAPAEGNTIVYTATWTEKSQVTVVFDFGTGESDSKVIYTGNTVAKPEDPTYAEHIFQGWYDKDGNAFDFATPITASLTLYARWAEDLNGNGKDDATEAKYTVTYKDGMNGAIFADEVKEVLVGMPTPE